MAPSAQLENQISFIRNFNRFYTRQIGLLDEGLLKSRFSLTESRVLYELAKSDGLKAANLVGDLPCGRRVFHCRC